MTYRLIATGIGVLSLIMGLMLSGCAVHPPQTHATDSAARAWLFERDALLPHTPTAAPDLLDRALQAAAAEPQTADIAPTRGHEARSRQSDSDLWQRIRAGFALPDETHRPLVQQYIDQYADQEQLEHLTARAEPYLYLVVEELAARDLPLELVLLPAVESAYEPGALSPGRAAGIWQFIPSTGKHFGLKQNGWYDGRRDIHASTQAAVTYLDTLHGLFDDWLLALAAYNAGQGTVERAIRRNRQAGRPTDFWHLDLPHETQHHVPKLLALSAIVKQPEQYDVSLWPIEDRPYLTLVDAKGQIDLKLAAHLANLELDDLQQLNPGFSRHATAPDGPHHLLLPIEQAGMFKDTLAQLPAEKRVNWKPYRVKPGETLEQIAQRHQTQVHILRQGNRLRGQHVRAGQQLLVPDLAANTHLAHAAPVRTAQAQAQSPSHSAANTHVHVVQPGDTLWNIARQYKVSVQELGRWNNLQGNRSIFPGQELTLQQRRDG